MAQPTTGGTYNTNPLKKFKYGLVYPAPHYKDPILTTM